MAQNKTRIDAPPEVVFDVLLQPESYGYWVVGSKDVRGADHDWPAVGSAFQHTLGAGPAEVRDETRITAIDPPNRLVLLAKAGTAGEARVELVLRPDGAGTEIVITEEPVSGPGTSLPGLLTDVPISARNIASLRRLKKLVESRRA